jgi:hypothetical protein
MTDGHQNIQNELKIYKIRDEHCDGSRPADGPLGGESGNGHIMPDTEVHQRCLPFSNLKQQQE